MATKSTTTNPTINPSTGFIRHGNQETNPAFAAPALIQAAQTGTSYSGGGSTPTDRYNGVSVNPAVPNADQTPYDSTKAAQVQPKAQLPVNPVQTPQTPAQTQTPQDQSYDLALKNLQTGGLQGADLQAANEALKRRYKGFVESQGKSEAPVQGADARSALATYKGGLPEVSEPYTPPPAVVETVDPILMSYSQAISEFLNPQVQRQSLVDEYRRFESELNIPGIKAEILNVNRIINGTEKDIRDEVTAAGGFATESQVRAMAVSRNQNLLNQSQYLTDQLNAAQDQLRTLATLSTQDREYAENKMMAGLNLMEKLYNLQQSQKRANTETYLSLYNSIGFDGLYSSTGGDPYYIDKVEKSLNLGAGSLERLSHIQTLRQQQEARLQGKAGGNGGKVLGVSIDANTTDGAVQNLSSTAQAVANNPSLLDDLTPTLRGQVITELSAAGYNTSELGTKPLSDTAIKEINQTNYALSSLRDLKTKISDNLQFVGPIRGLSALNPWSKARKVQSDVDRVRQTVGKALEGGVLRKEDEEKYKKILATLTDTPNTAIYKIDNLIKAIAQNLTDYEGLQKRSGKSLNVKSPLKNTETQVQGSANIEDVKTKFNINY